jgi:hypothetical protein
LKLVAEVPDPRLRQLADAHGTDAVVLAQYVIGDVSLVQLEVLARHPFAAIEAGAAMIQILGAGDGDRCGTITGSSLYEKTANLRTSGIMLGHPDTTTTPIRNANTTKPEKYADRAGFGSRSTFKRSGAPCLTDRNL